jgi:coproporphyrinogen III oxidase-like Fe-S oxidoreductase
VDIADPTGWMAAPDPIATRERPEAEAMAFELLWSTLRHVDGVDRARLRALTGLEVEPPRHLLDTGVLIMDTHQIRLTEAGFPLADAVTEHLARGLRPAAEGPSASHARGNVRHLRGPGSGSP